MKKAVLEGQLKSRDDVKRELAKCNRVKQVFVRHVFRFWMGRNETLEDAPVLREAY